MSTGLRGHGNVSGIDAWQWWDVHRRDGEHRTGRGHGNVPGMDTQPWQ